MRLIDSPAQHGLVTALVLAGGFAALSSAAAGAPAAHVQTLTPRTGLPSAKPAACSRAMTEGINPSGGAFTFPRCGGTIARITYGPNNAPASSTFTFTSTTTNPNPSICGYVASDTVFFPIEYVLVNGNGSAGVTFQATSASSHIRVRRPNQGAPYSLWALFNNQIQFEESLGSPNSRGRFTFPSPLTNQTLPLGLPICFEFGEGP